MNVKLSKDEGYSRDKCENRQDYQKKIIIKLVSCGERQEG